MLQVCRLVCPDGYGTLQAAIIEVQGQRSEEKKQSIEGEIVAILQDMAPDGFDSWETPLEDVKNHLNEKRYDKHKLSSQGLGKRIKALGLTTRITHGHSKIFMTRDVFSRLLDEYSNNSFSTPQENSPNSPNQDNLNNSKCYGGENDSENGESGENSPETHRDKPTDFKTEKYYGDNGEFIEGNGEDELEVIEGSTSE